MSDHNAAAGILQLHARAQATARGRQRRGLDVKTLSITGAEPFTDEQLVGYNRLVREMRRYARTYDLATTPHDDGHEMMQGQL